MAKALTTSERHGWARFVSMQNHYNLMYREEEREMVPLCLDAGVGMIPWSPLARGLLTRPRPADRTVHTPDTARSASDAYSLELYGDPNDWEVVDALERVAATRRAPMAEMALAWLLSRPCVAAPIVGATKLGHLESAIRAVDLELTRDETSALDAVYRPHPVRGLV